MSTDIELVQRAAAGLHDDCARLIERHAPAPRAVVDLAAGTGAFPSRLSASGYDVVANDIDDAPWAVADVPKFAFDLEEPVAAKFPRDRYDVVVAMEVIEHLKNPQGLLGHCRELVADDGIILLSTPNVLDLTSRLIYLRSGFTFHISPHAFDATGHRAMLPDWLLEIMIAESGLTVVDKIWGGKRQPLNSGAREGLIERILAGVARRFVRDANNAQLDANYLIYILSR